MIAKKPWPKLSRDHGETCLWTTQKELVFEIRQCLCFDLPHVVSTHNFSRLGAQHSFCTVTQNRFHAVQFDLQWTLKQLWLPKDITRRHADTKLGQETDVSELGSKLFKDQKLYDHSSVEPSRRARSRTQRRATSAATRSRPLPPAAPAAHRCAIESHFYVMASRDREIGFWTHLDPISRITALNRIQCFTSADNYFVYQSAGLKDRCQKINH